MVLVDGNVIESLMNKENTSTVNEVFLYHVKVIYVLAQITSCDVVIVEAFHDYIVGRRPSMTLLLEMRGRSQCMLLMRALERYFSI